MIYELHDLHCRDSILEISIAHNGSKLTCNIKSHSDYVPKHATLQRGQVNESPDFMSYRVSSTLQNASKCCRKLHKHHVYVRKADCHVKRLQERWSQRENEPKFTKEQGDLVHYNRSCINTSHIMSVLHLRMPRISRTYRQSQKEELNIKEIWW